MHGGQNCVLICTAIPSNEAGDTVSIRRGFNGQEAFHRLAQAAAVGFAKNFFLIQLVLTIDSASVDPAIVGARGALLPTHGQHPVQMHLSTLGTWKDDGRLIFLLNSCHNIVICSQ